MIPAARYIRCNDPAPRFGTERTRTAIINFMLPVFAVGVR
jgi:hypothetical protein